MDSDERKILNELLRDAHDIYSVLASAYLDRTGDYGKLAIQSAFIVNGGGLVAIPVYLTESGAGVSISPSHLVYSFFSFVVGIIFAALASYVIYINWAKLFSSHHSTYVNNRNNIIKAFDENHEFKELVTSKDDKHVRITFVLGHIFGIFSYVSFAAGCGFAWYFLWFLNT